LPQNYTDFKGKEQQKKITKVWPLCASHLGLTIRYCADKGVKAVISIE